MENIEKYNKIAWNKYVEDGIEWSLPVSDLEIKEAFIGVSKMFLTPTKPIPSEWLGNVKGKKVLCLASGGGQ